MIKNRYRKPNAKHMSTKLAYLRHYLILFSFIYTFLFPQYSWAYLNAPEETILAGSYLAVANLSLPNEESQLVTLQGHTLIQTNNPITPISAIRGPVCPTSNKRLVIITAYSSALEETDDSPFITASGSYVRDGIIAANFLKIGTQVKIPALYGDKIFVVEDRMAKKNSHKVDIWMPSKSLALQFGVKRAEILVLEN